MPSQTRQPDNVLPAHRALSFLKSVEQGEVIFRCYRSTLLKSMTWYIAPHRNCTIVTFSALSSAFEARSDVSEGDGNWHRLHVKQKSASFGQTSLYFRNASCSWMGGIAFSWFFKTEFWIKVWRSEGEINLLKKEARFTSFLDRLYTGCVFSLFFSQWNWIGRVKKSHPNSKMRWLGHVSKSATGKLIRFQMNP